MSDNSTRSRRNGDTPAKRRRITYGSGRLSRPSMPEFPRHPSLNNIKEWLRERNKFEQEGIELLIAHYCERLPKSTDINEYFRALLERRAVSRSSLESEYEKLRSLLLALASDHVPYFSSSRRKSSTIDNHALARLLDDYYGQLRKGHRPIEARAIVRRRMHGRLAGATDARMQNLLSKARKMFMDTVVKIATNNSLEPIGPFEARIWDFHLNGPRSDLASRVTREPNPDNPDGVLINIESPNDPLPGDKVKPGV